MGFLDRQCHIDLDPEDVQSDPRWRLWAWEHRPLARLHWDPGEWQWQDLFASPNSPEIPFFQYTTHLGRHILIARRGATPAAAEHWHRQGLSRPFLTNFWQSPMEEPAAETDSDLSVASCS